MWVLNSSIPKFGLFSVEKKCKGHVKTCVFCNFFLKNFHKFFLLTLRISVLHDFIMESEIKEMKSIAMPILKRSSTVGKSMNGSLSDYRVSEQTWITEEMSPNGAAKLTKRIEGNIVMCFHEKISK